MKFKVIAYKMLQDIINAGALGVEIVLSGRLPSERAKSWRFSQGYLKKTGEPAKVVQRAMAQAVNLQGVTGIKVSILPPNAHIHDKIVITPEFLSKVRVSVEPVEEAAEKIEEKEVKKIKEKKSSRKKEEKETEEKPAKKKKAKESK